ncbi:SIR2 family protein [Virgibacillus natechei]|uniref:SIR2 family protein n=1 Tax=Virgibacillus sp. CBA3643 TaxID=2942278 RepID=UPI0035A2CB10
MVNKNEYPILFFGSGIPKRYSKKFPSWEELLEYYWKIIQPDRNFYAELNSIRTSIEHKHPEYNVEDLDYFVNIEAGTYISKAFDEKYFNQEIEIEDFSQKQAYKTKIRPFKKAIANKFAQYEIKEEMLEEFYLFQKVLNKSQIILTTNYDSLIEEAFNSISDERLKVYVGQKGFFEQTIGWAELYKIHGSIDDPDSIIIDKRDYEVFDKNSVLISAKIISMLLTSPIIFMGYSLSDKNIRKIIKEFSSSMTSTDMKIMASRIIIVEWNEDIDGITEQVVHDKDLKCDYTVLTTSSFSLIYDYLIRIDQGVHPAEVRKYQKLIKELIVDSGQKGTLNTLLLSPHDLDDIETKIGNEQLVVALGDKAYIFDMPDLMSYIQDYFYNKSEIHTEIALRFLANLQPKSRIPFVKYVQDVDLDNTKLNSDEKEKIRQRWDRFKDVDTAVNSVPKPYKIKMNSMTKILESNFRKDKEVEVIAYNFKRLDNNDIEAYIEEELERLRQISVNKIHTSFRRLLLIYDLFNNKKD